MRRSTVGILTACVGLASLGVAKAEPPLVPQAPVLTQPVRKGALKVFSLPSVAQRPAYVVDGDPAEWVGSPTMIGGTSIVSRGELIYTDYVGDDHGADNGQDAARTAMLDPVMQDVDRSYRAEVLAQAAGEQFGAPDDGIDLTKALVADANYGDANQGAAKNEADLTEVRVTADDSNLFLLARFAGMANISRTGLGIYLGHGTSESVAPGGITTRAEKAIIVDRSGITSWNSSCSGCSAAVNGTGFTNTIEVSLPLAYVDPDQNGSAVLSVAAGISNGSGGFQDVSPVGSDLINVAFREDSTDAEPIRIWMDHDQALALHAGTIDQYAKDIDIQDLQTGSNQGFSLGSGYFERVYVSDSPVNEEREDGQYYQGPWQHYGLYLPSAYRPGRQLGVTWWTHYRGGHAHDAASWLPGLIHSMAEAHDRILVSPSARGTSSWYVGRGYEDFLDVWDDFDSSFAFDRERVIMSGYSMGGFASWLLPLTTPDRFAGAFPTSGPPTQGLWAGVGNAMQEQNNAYDADAELLFTIAENARNIRYAIYHGTNDELVPYTGVARMASRLTELGYEHRFYTMPGYEHFTHAIVDDWRDAAAYLESARSSSAPANVTYRRWPALERAVNTVNTPVPLNHRFDGAYWVDEIELRDAGTPDANGRPDVTKHATVNATSLALSGPNELSVPEAGIASQHWTPAPYVGIDRVTLNAQPGGLNVFTIDLTNVSTVDLDGFGMALDPSSPIGYRVTSDGASTVNLRFGDIVHQIEVSPGSSGGFLPN
jgi:pimeloyl-ACP methyl ester carboxylesterase